MLPYWPAAASTDNPTLAFRAASVSAVSVEAFLECRAKLSDPEVNEYVLQVVINHIYLGGEGDTYSTPLSSSFAAQYLGESPTVCSDPLVFTPAVMPNTGIGGTTPNNVLPPLVLPDGCEGCSEETRSTVIGTVSVASEPQTLTVRPADTFWCHQFCQPSGTPEEETKACVQQVNQRPPGLPTAPEGLTSCTRFMGGGSVPFEELWYYQAFVGAEACEADCGESVTTPVYPTYCVWCRDMWRQCSTLTDETASEICEEHGGVLLVPTTAVCTDCDPVPFCYECAEDDVYGVYLWQGEPTPFDTCAAHGGVAHRWLLGEGDSPCGVFPFGCSCSGETTPENTGTGTYTGPYGVTDPNPLWDDSGPAAWLGLDGAAIPGFYIWTFEITTATNAGFRGKVWGDDRVRIYLDSNPDPALTTVLGAFHSPTEFCLLLTAGTHTVTFQVENSTGGFSPVGLKVEWLDCNPDPPVMMVAMTAVDAEPARKPLPCVHEGHTCPPPPGGKPNRTYLRCDVGRGVNGTVCRCDCNPSCEEYEPAD